MLFQVVTFPTILLTRGNATKAIGNPATNPIPNPLNHFCIKPGRKPTFIAVSMSDMKNAINNDMKSAFNIGPYFSLFI